MNKHVKVILTRSEAMALAHLAADGLRLLKHSPYALTVEQTRMLAWGKAAQVKLRDAQRSAKRDLSVKVSMQRARRFLRNEQEKHKRGKPSIYD
jgi:hypothetical protein